MFGPVFERCVPQDPSQSRGVLGRAWKPEQDRGVPPPTKQSHGVAFVSNQCRGKTLVPIHHVAEE